jgi:flagellar protein FlgJ
VTAREVFGAGFDGLPRREQLRAAARELEAVVVAQVFGAMRKSVPESGLFGDSVANDLFRTMLDAELARHAARKSPFGLADSLVREYENGIKGVGAEAEGAGKPRAGDGAARPSRRI